MGIQIDSAVRITVVEMGRTRGEVAARHGSFGRWFVEAFAGVAPDLKVGVVRVEEAGGGSLEAAAGVVLSGALEGVYDPLPWRERFDGALERLIDSGKPVLGVCFGHQYLTQLLGGRVEHRPEREELGWYEVELTEAGEADPLFEGVGRRFGVLESHWDMVAEAASGSTLLARSRTVPVQAVRRGERVWGVQFHPEMTVEITETALKEAIGKAQREGEEERARRLSAGSDLTGRANDGVKVLANFARICAGSR